jgi:hypothetical protein
MYKFNLGKTVITRGAKEILEPEEVFIALGRYLNGDWGDLEEEDKESNEEALKGGYRIIAAYISRNGEEFWIITERDRSLTTILLPSEY